MNWMFFFGVGRLYQKHENVELYKKRKKVLIVWVLLVLFSIVLSFSYFKYCYMSAQSPIYWNSYAIAMKLIGIPTIFLGCILINKRKNILVDIGRYTYPIYFIHMQLGINTVYLFANRIMNVNEHFLMIFVIPVLVLFVSYFIVRLARYLFKKFNIDSLLWVFAFG